MDMIQIRAEHNKTLYPIYRFDGYTMKEAMQRYRIKYGLKYKRNVKFTKF